MVNVSNNSASMQPMSNVQTQKKGNKTKEKSVQRLKNTAQMGTAIGVTAYGYNKINKSMHSKPCTWNKKINNRLSTLLKKMTETVITTGNDPFMSDAFKVTKKGRIVFDKTHAHWKELSPFKKFAANAMKKITNFSLDVVEKLSKTSGRQKALGLFVATAATGLLLLARKQGYKHGQIDQKYKDQTNNKAA